MVATIHQCELSESVREVGFQAMKVMIDGNEHDDDEHDDDEHDGAWLHACSSLSSP